MGAPAKKVIPAAVAKSGEIVDPSAAADSVVLRGVTVALDTDVGQAFVLDCCRNTEGLMADHEVKIKFELSDADWERLADNIPLLQAVREERERRILSGETARERALRHFTEAPNVLNRILTNEQIAPRHRIEAARELRQAATTGTEISAEPKEKITINIDFGADCKIVREITVPERPPSDDGEVR